jgi:hypothetical protein
VGREVIQSAVGTLENAGTRSVGLLGHWGLSEAVGARASLSWQDDRALGSRIAISTGLVVGW